VSGRLTERDLPCIGCLMHVDYSVMLVAVNKLERGRYDRQLVTSHNTLHHTIIIPNNKEIKASVSVCLCCQLFAAVSIYTTVLQLLLSTTYSFSAPTLRRTTNIFMLSSYSLPLLVFYHNSCIHTFHRSIEITAAVCCLCLAYATTTV
jgi:hypothetical protein